MVLGTKPIGAGGIAHHWAIWVSDYWYEIEGINPLDSNSNNRASALSEALGVPKSA